ncbi:MAG: MetQ/NlpA family ABC transporter substrate-binding protein [Oscillospiraceae bacterium]|jgi:D-methionine transport system substrate-binding protein|nr:MetQ/NlpA family ABC transporter substrate-binding protein [Oscillospiraceae bacterium]
MRKFLSLIIVIILAVSLFAACNNDDGDSTVLIIGATPSPHSIILEQVVPLMAAQGFTLEIVEFTDFVQPNLALADGSIDANYFQHTPYLTNMSARENLDLTAVFGMHYEPMGLYPGRTTSLDAIPDRAQIAIPNDATNGGRALWLLQDAGLITMSPGAAVTATVHDIADNPLNLNIVEMEAAQIPRVLQDVDFGVINGNFALQAGLSVATDSLAKEEVDSLAAETYVNVVAVRTGFENDARIAALQSAMQSDAIRAFIEDRWQGAVIPKFN